MDYLSHNFTCSQCKDKSVYHMNTLKYATMQRSSHKKSFRKLDGLVGWSVVLGLKDSISVYIGPSPSEREKEKRNDR